MLEVRLITGAFNVIVVPVPVEKSMTSDVPPFFSAYAQIVVAGVEGSMVATLAGIEIAQVIKSLEHIVFQRDIASFGSALHSAHANGFAPHALIHLDDKAPPIERRDGQQVHDSERN